MGFISTLVVLNDHIHEIEKDAEFGSKVARAIFHLPVQRPVWVGHGAVAIESHNNVGFVPILVGKGMGYPMSVAVDPTQGEDVELTLLKRLADKHGYRLAKRPAVTRGR